MNLEKSAPVPTRASDEKILPRLRPAHSYHGQRLPRLRCPAASPGAGHHVCTRQYPNGTTADNR